MGRVADILTTKGANVQSVAPDTPAYDAVARMVKEGVGSMIVTDGSTIAGIFTERDFLRRVILENRNPKTTTVGDVMTSKVIVVERTTTIQDCLSIMTRERIRHLPVIEESKLIGMISIGDLVKHLSKEQAVEIRFLTEYITGRTP